MQKFSVSGRMLAILILMFLPAGHALADEWTAVKLRGGVFEFSNGDWHQLARGATVPDDRVIRTMRDGRVEFHRGMETIDMGPNTQIRIFDQGSAKFTIVQQHFGEVAIEAEKRQIQHFAVQTEYVAAIVKGTRFTVRSGDGRADVLVDQGEVEVRDVTRKLVVRVRPGQEAGAGSGERDVLSISGRGELDQVAAFQGNVLADDVVVDRSPEALADVANVVAAVKGGMPVTAIQTDDLPPGLVKKLTDSAGLTPGKSNGNGNGVAGAKSNGNSGNAGGNKAKSGAVGKTVSTVTDTVSNVTGTATDSLSGAVNSLVSSGNSNGAGDSGNSNAGRNGKGKAKGLGTIVNGLLN